MTLSKRSAVVTRRVRCGAGSVKALSSFRLRFVLTAGGSGSSPAPGSSSAQHLPRSCSRAVLPAPWSLCPPQRHASRRLGSGSPEGRTAVPVRVCARRVRVRAAPCPCGRALLTLRRGAGVGGDRGVRRGSDLRARRPDGSSEQGAVVCLGPAGVVGGLRSGRASGLGRPGF